MLTFINLASMNLASDTGSRKMSSLSQPQFRSSVSHSTFSSMTAANVLLFDFLDLSLVIRSSEVHSSEGIFRMYFPLVRFGSATTTCLNLNFTTYGHFSVELIYRTVDLIQSKTIYSNQESFEGEFNQWCDSITPQMIDGADVFHVVLKVRTNESSGIVSVINSVGLSFDQCNVSGAGTDLPAGCILSKEAFLLRLLNSPLL